MGLTHFPHGVSSMGVPVLGGGGQRFVGWWGKSRFVDYDDGSDSNKGLDIDHPMKNLQTAIDASTVNDVIYIRNREQDITSTDPEYIVPASTTNWSVAEAQTHLSIIGASNVSHIPAQEGPLAVYLRGHSTANTTAVIDWRGAFGLIENVALHRGGSTAGGLIALTGNSTSLRALGTVVSNCLFRLYSSTSHGAVYCVDNWFITVYGCDFHDCRIGVHFVGSSSTIRRSRVSQCLFRNQTAASVDQNILVSGSSTQDFTIDGCKFTQVPAQGTTNLFINFTAAATGLIYDCYFPSDTNEGTTNVTNNGVFMTGCHQAIAESSGPEFGKAS